MHKISELCLSMYSS